MSQSLYDTLGVTRAATDDEIKKAYKAAHRTELRERHRRRGRVRPKGRPQERVFGRAVMMRFGEEAVIGAIVDAADPFAALDAVLAR